MYSKDSVYQKAAAAVEGEKKVTASDGRFLRTAEDNLYGELAISLGIDRKAVEGYIIDKIEVQ